MLHFCDCNLILKKMENFYDDDLDFEDNFDLNVDDIFSISDDFETRYIKPPKSKEISDIFMKYDNAKKLANDIEINKNSRYFVLLNCSFIFGDFIEALMVEKNYLAKKIFVSTLSMSEDNIDSLANLVNGEYVESLSLIVSDYFFAHERSNLIPYLYKELDKNNITQLSVAGVHTKICLIETDCGKKIVIHGSANLRSSQNIEQIMIEENELLYDFNFEYHQAIENKYFTIDKPKPIRGQKLWQVVQVKKD